MTVSLENLDPARHWDDAYKVLESSEDFVHFSEGRPATPATVDDFFSATPSGRRVSDSAKLGVTDETGRVIGLVDLAYGYPDPKTWYLGLLLVTPCERRRGVGREVMADIVHRARDEKIRRLRIAVFEENESALRFWRRLGFREIFRHPPRLFGEKAHGRIEMDMTLDAAPSDAGVAPS